MAGVLHKFGRHEAAYREDVGVSKIATPPARANFVLQYKIGGMVVNVAVFTPKICSSETT